MPGTTGGSRAEPGNDLAQSDRAHDRMVHRLVERVERVQQGRSLVAVRYAKVKKFGGTEVATWPRSWPITAFFSLFPLLLVLARPS